MRAIRPEDWETQEQVDACLAATGTTMDQVRRWRREGLLQDVVQDQNRYNGSAVRYPVGTCAQIAAAARLFKVKNRVAFVGWQLWWQGFPVDEKFWLPLLMDKAKFFDRTVARIKSYIAGDETREKRPTLQERVAKSRVTNIIMSRIRGRQSRQALATTLAPVIQVATGEFEHFSVSDAVTEGDDTEQALTIDAFNLEASKTDKILGHQLHLVRELPNMYRLIARALASGALSSVLRQPDHVIFHARDYVRNAFRIYVAQYEAVKWIYGPRAFGLRLGAWIGRKSPDWLMPLIILGFARLRQTTNEMLSSEEIASLAAQAEENARMSSRIRAIAKADPKYRKVYSPKRIRAAFLDKPAMDQWKREIEAVRAG
jgi:hypothetical protein